MILNWNQILTKDYPLLRNLAKLIIENNLQTDITISNDFDHLRDSTYYLTFLNEPFRSNYTFGFYQYFPNTIYLIYRQNDWVWKPDYREDSKLKNLNQFFEFSKLTSSKLVFQDMSAEKLYQLILFLLGKT